MDPGSVLAGLSGAAAVLVALLSLWLAFGFWVNRARPWLRERWSA